MQFKIKIISIVFAINTILLILNIKYQDETLSVVQDLTYGKLFLFFGFFCFVFYLIIAKFKKAFNVLLIFATIAFCISLFFNLRLAKDNYDRIQCNEGISEYFEYFEYDSCEKIKKRFEYDLINRQLKYFLDPYNHDLEFEEKIRNEKHIELVGISCTQFTSMECYNELVKNYIKKSD
ncbi:hypothetical protein [Mesoflavibacter sp. SCSIO 43206]|uniref:hypothetical protein n=1 Tax=Mesoflavibacter sp. SCSIO 43206 TaxID=2779362 RepID=UPI001CAA1C0D|nr:hypothetical protein [Mesoflavibacter sp. SCSIO 43206]UAB75636.1 hypothetical protein INR78_01205 [Mesoflavibacter sp. SCSIO 43206]